MLEFILGWLCCLCMVTLEQHLNKKYHKLLKEHSPSELMKVDSYLREDFMEGFNDSKKP